MTDVNKRADWKCNKNFLKNKVYFTHFDEHKYFVSSYLYINKNKLSGWGISLLEDIVMIPWINTRLVLFLSKIMAEDGDVISDKYLPKMYF